MNFVKSIFSSVIDTFRASVGKGDGAFFKHIPGLLAIVLTSSVFLFWVLILDRKTTLHFRAVPFWAVVLTIVVLLFFVLVSIVIEKIIL